MGLMDWMKSGKKKQDVNVSKVAEQTVDMGEMAAGNQVAANAALDRMMAQKSATTKILVVQDGDYMPQVTEYALKMAQRLDCDVVALDVTDAPLQFSGERKAQESKRFTEKALANGAKFVEQAEAVGVSVQHVMEIAESEEVIARISSEDAGIRYVLTKPDLDIPREDHEQAQVPVFDLHCSCIAR